MGEITEIKLVGQPIFKQVMNLIGKVDIQGLIRRHESDFYHRTLSDLLVFQYKTILILKTRKFKCKDTTCHHKVFSEQTPYMMRYAIRTTRASQVLDSLSIELIGKLGSMLSKHFSISVSPSAVIPIALKQQFTDF